MTTILFHYTCDHALPKILRSRMLKPNPQPAVRGIPLVWLTDMAIPDRHALGLTSYMLACDRAAHRLTLHLGAAEHAVPWVVFARMQRLTIGERHVIEGATGAQPLRWWVATQPLGLVSPSGRPPKS